MTSNPAGAILLFQEQANYYHSVGEAGRSDIG